MTVRQPATLADLPAWVRALPHFGHQPITLGSVRAVGDRDNWVAAVLEDLGWTVEARTQWGQRYLHVEPPAYVEPTCTPGHHTANCQAMGGGAGDGWGRTDFYVDPVPTPWQDMIDAVERGEIATPF